MRPASSRQEPGLCVSKATRPPLSVGRMWASAVDACGLGWGLPAGSRGWHPRWNLDPSRSPSLRQLGAFEAGGRVERPTVTMSKLAGQETRDQSRPEVLRSPCGLTPLSRGAGVQGRRSALRMAPTLPGTSHGPSLPGPQDCAWFSRTPLRGQPRRGARLTAAMACLPGPGPGVFRAPALGPGRGPARGP